MKLDVRPVDNQHKAQSTKLARISRWLSKRGVTGASFSKYLDRSKSHFTGMRNNLPSSLPEEHGKEAWIKIKKLLTDADAQRVFTERLPEKSNCNEP